jgi:hypothetical protein
VQPAAGVNLPFSIRRRQTTEGIRHPDTSRGIGVSCQHAAHQNDGTTAPNAGFDQVAGNSFAQDRLDAGLQMIQPLASDHGVCPRGPVMPLFAKLKEHSPIGMLGPRRGDQAQPDAA